MNDDRLFWIVMGIIAAGAVILIINDGEGQSFGIDNYDFSQLIWLGALGLVVASGVFARGLPAGHTLRQLAIWLIIFLAIAVGYQLAERYGLIPGEPVKIPPAPPGSERTV
jgi:aspartyl protease family protein